MLRPKSPTRQRFEAALALQQVPLYHYKAVGWRWVSCGSECEGKRKTWRTSNALQFYWSSAG